MDKLTTAVLQENKPRGGLMSLSKMRQ